MDGKRRAVSRYLNSEIPSLVRTAEAAAARRSIDVQILALGHCLKRHSGVSGIQIRWQFCRLSEGRGRGVSRGTLPNPMHLLAANGPRFLFRCRRTALPPPVMSAPARLPAHPAWPEAARRWQPLPTLPGPIFGRRPQPCGPRTLSSSRAKDIDLPPAPRPPLHREPKSPQTFARSSVRAR